MSKLLKKINYYAAILFLFSILAFFVFLFLYIMYISNALPVVAIVVTLVAGVFWAGITINNYND